MNIALKEMVKSEQEQWEAQSQLEQELRQILQGKPYFWKWIFGNNPEESKEKYGTPLCYQCKGYKPYCLYAPNRYADGYDGGYDEGCSEDDKH